MRFVDLEDKKGRDAYPWLCIAYHLLKNMTIHLVKFGSVLTSRQAGKEAYAAFFQTLAGVHQAEDVLVDFTGIISFSPSWGDEFLTPLQKKFGNRLTLKNLSNPSVALTISTLERINDSTFKKV